jgi:YD repeat-containing protein
LARRYRYDYDEQDRPSSNASGAGMTRAANIFSNNERR